MRFRSVLILLCLTALLCLPAGPYTPVTQTPLARAQDDAEPDPDTETALESGTIPFHLLDIEETTLRGPISTQDYYFSLPSDWELTEGARVVFNLTTFYNSSSGFTMASGMLVGSIEVQFNEVTVDTIPITWAGDRIVTVDIPVEALVSPFPSGRHVLSLKMQAMLDCDRDFDVQTVVVVRDTSRMVLPHTYAPPNTNLERLPQPIYQQTFMPDEVVVVLPDQPTTAELQAFLTVMAGLGRMSYRQLDVTVATEATLTREQRESQHLVLVGKPQTMPLLANITWPVPVARAQFDSAEMQPDDGVLQMIVSPWNRSKVALVVGGNTDVGIVKAAQAFSTGDVRNSGEDRPNIALVSSVEEETSEPELVPPDTQTFEELGYDTETRTENGEFRFEYTFYIPHGYVPTGDSYVELAFTNAAMLDYEQSGISVFMNDQVIGGAEFSEETTSLSRQRITIPTSTLKVGTNRLAVHMLLTSIDECLPQDLQGVWGTIWKDSIIHNPVELAQKRVVQVADLSQYPEPFVSSPTLATTAFVMPRDSPQAWLLASTIAFNLGADTPGELVELLAVYGDEVTNKLRRSHDLLIVGLPSRLKVIDDLASLLPVPFEPGSNVAMTQGTRIIYRFPPTMPIGYLQLLNPPDTPNRTVLAVLGNNDQGVQFASTALTDPELNWQLKGNFAIVNNRLMTFGDTRRGGDPENIAATAVPTGTITERPITETMTISQEEYQEIISDPSGPGKAGWILPALAITLSMMVLLAVGLGFFTWRKHRSPARVKLKKR